ncbi:MAG TPA: hypothetical protein VIK18_19185, partial [Pirellulales bacterium]
MSHHLPPLADIPVPEPKPDEIYTHEFFGEQVSLRGLKRLLGAADCSKAGDRGAGLSAPSEKIREAARAMLGALTLGHL